MKRHLKLGTAAALVAAALTTPVIASSHREAPLTTEKPKTDNTDVYAFRSYEPGREQFVTLIANFQPIEVPGAGPNYYTMDPDAIYEIHIDSNGDAIEDLTYQFKFTNTLRGNAQGITLNVGGKQLPIALRHAGPVTQVDDADLGEVETYTIFQVTGDRRSGGRAGLTLQGAATPNTLTFTKPLDNVGNKTTPNYPAYAAQFIHPITIPNCTTAGRVFVGQRAEAFAVNVGPIFDLVNFVPIDGDATPGSGAGGGFPGGIRQSAANQGLIGKANVTSIALELPISCVTGAGNGVIGVWSTASLPQARLIRTTPTHALPEYHGGAFAQVSRLGMPLVNELIIGLPQKDLFNAAKPRGDAALLDYVTNPTLPAILNALFLAPVNQTLGTNMSTIAPTNFPRNDLVAAFLTGLTGLNKQTTVTPSEMLRLNTGIAAKAAASQNSMGVLADDLAGFPNGRRPGDDVVDIELRVAMGRLCHPVTLNGQSMSLGLCNPSDAPTGTVAYTDGAPSSATTLLTTFPYLNHPLRGAPLPQNVP